MQKHFLGVAPKIFIWQPDYDIITILRPISEKNSRSNYAIFIFASVFSWKILKRKNLLPLLPSELTLFLRVRTPFGRAFSSKKAKGVTKVFPLGKTIANVPICTNCTAVAISPFACFFET